MRIGFLCFAVCALAAGPAAAEWQFRWAGTSAGVWTTNADGTSLALSCDRRRDGRMRVEYTVAPTANATGDATGAVFEIGGAVTEVQVEAYVPSGGRLQIMRSDLAYDDPEIVALRAQLSGGNRVSLPAQAAFEAASFDLRGSGAALRQLEEACAQIWEQG
ncbi:hypothetical protein [Gymnodinialimonas ulvae]|uniref:hypothetical protein n=1 Tax=Gymnodinialimonas ulvae TaxID=3126504 RepID=UPI00309E35DC